MYTIGLPAAAAAFRAAPWPAVLVIALIVLLAIRTLYNNALLEATQQENSPPSLPSSWGVVRSFYKRRFDLLRDGFVSTGSSFFKINLVGHTVLAVSGAAGRKAILTAPSLDLNEGFKVLSGAIPIVAGITSELPTKALKLIHKRLGAVQTHDRLTQLIPLLLEDCRRNLTSWADTGSFDPFSRIHEVVFQFTVRALSCAELADDREAVARLHALYETLDRGNTPAAVLLPWLPSPAAISNTWTSKKIYDTLLNVVHQRQTSIAQGSLPANDTLQMLLDEQTAPELIVGFMMGLIVAGSRSTGTTAAWILTFLASHPQWHTEIHQELQNLLASHATQLHDKDAGITAQLASVPLQAWETATPMLDKVIRETLRLAQPHVAMRRNMGPELTLPGGASVPSGSFVVYPFSDVHLDSSLYPEPWRFDPSRPEPKGVEFGYVGWGGGKTICAGQRLARLKLKLLVATYTLGFRSSVTDKSGVRQIPKPNWNDALTCKPAEGCVMHYERTALKL